MHRCLAHLAMCGRYGLGGPGNAGHAGRHAMTAPLKHSDPITVDVALGDRAYDIVIGRDVLPSLGARVAKLRPGARAAIVTDRNVAGYWLEKTEASLSKAGIVTSRIIVDEGEGSKTYAGLEQVSEALISSKIERNDLVVALGGGVIGDLAGFAAASTRRGLDFVQVPTTLLAQVDSSVGGKTGINSRHGKNLVGAFHQPILVVADTALLDTLPKREFRAGYAEMVKFGLLGDAAFFSWLEANWQDIFAGKAAREHAIAVCCRGKDGIVAPDERTTGGGALASSPRKGMISEADAARARAHLAAVGLPTHLKDVPGGVPRIDALMDLIAQDKKVKRGKLTFILVRGIGQAFVENDVSAAEVRAFLADKLAEK